MILHGDKIMVYVTGISWSGDGMVNISYDIVRHDKDLSGLQSEGRQVIQKIIKQSISFKDTSLPLSQQIRGTIENFIVNNGLLPSHEKLSDLGDMQINFIKQVLEEKQEAQLRATAIVSPTKKK